MLNNFFIPTYKRHDAQITFSNLPKSWQDRTFLVVQQDEQHLYKDYPHIVLPVEITKVPEKREWIAKQNLDKRFGVFDDDLKFFKTRMINDDYEKSKIKMEDKDFDDLEELLCGWMDEGIVFCGMDVTSNIPDREKEYKEITRQWSNFFFDGPNFPANELDWTSIRYAEDFHVTLQLFKMGYKNRLSNKYRVDPGPVQSGGGLTDERTIQAHNESMQKLALAHPGLVALYEKETTAGEWKNTAKVAANISWKKAFKDANSTTLESFF
jgi:hypothetical protein